MSSVLLADVGLLSVDHIGRANSKENKDKCCSRNFVGIRGALKWIRASSINSYKYQMTLRLYVHLEENNKNPDPKQIISKYFPKSESIAKDPIDIDHGFVVDRHGKKTDIMWIDIQAQIDRNGESVSSILSRNDLRPIPQIENFFGSEYYGFTKCNHSIKLWDELGEVAKIRINKLHQSHNVTELTVVAWQIRNAIYNVVNSYRDDKFENLQSKLLAWADFEVHLLTHEGFTRKQTGMMDLGSRDFNDIFGTNRFLLSLADITREYAYAWYVITKNRTKGTIEEGVREFQKEYSRAKGRIIAKGTVKKKYYTVKRRFEQPIKSILGDENGAFNTQVCLWIMEEILNNQEFIWKTFKRHT